MGAIFTAIITGFITNILGTFGLPGLTMPFVMVCQLFILAGNSMKKLFSVDLGAVSIPEDNKRRYLLIE